MFAVVACSIYEEPVLSACVCASIFNSYIFTSPNVLKTDQWKRHELSFKLQTLIITLIQINQVCFFVFCFFFPVVCFKGSSPSSVPELMSSRSTRPRNATGCRPVNTQSPCPFSTMRPEMCTASSVWAGLRWGTHNCNTMSHHMGGRRLSLAIAKVHTVPVTRLLLDSASCQSQTVTSSLSSILQKLFQNYFLVHGFSTSFTNTSYQNVIIDRTQLYRHFTAGVNHDRTTWCFLLSNSNICLS